MVGIAPRYVAALLLSGAVLGVTRADTFHLAPGGDDDAPGSREAPWRSIDKANATLQAGDTAIFLPGEYPGTIAPVSSGSEGSPITYRSADPWSARLVPRNGAWAVRAADSRHLRIEGFAIDGGGSGGWVLATGCEHLTVAGCRMRDAGPTMQINDSRQIKLLDNLFSKDRVTGNMVQVQGCSEVLIEGNVLTRVGHSPLQITTCVNVVVRANCFRNDWGRNYEFWSTGRILVEDNVVTEARDSGYSADSRAKNLYVDGIFRFNRVFGNRHTPLNSGSYLAMGAKPTARHREPFRLANSRIYHNTIADNLGNGWQINGLNISSNIFQNNIFHGNDQAGGKIQFWRGEGISQDNRIVANLFRGTEPGQAVIRHGQEEWTAVEANRKTRVLEGFWSEFADNVDADPDFVDAAARDFRLGSASGARDAGRPLALAIGSGSGRALPVSDGVPFYDGFGIAGETGDWIAVGSGDSLARIQRVDLRYYQPAILHLDRDVTWTDGMPVSLPWAGAGPDLGAFERDVHHPNRLVALAAPSRTVPGQPIQFSLDTLGKTMVEATWCFDDGSLAKESSPRHAFRNPGGYGVTVRARFADGEEGVAVVFVEVAEPVPPGAPLVMADFEDATRESHWGFHFKFYRSWLTGFAHEPRPDGTGKAMRLFYDPAKANRAAGAVAPGLWDIDAYPFVRLAYRIPAGVPVALCVEPFEATGRPRGFILGGTPSRVAPPYVDLDTCALVDDGTWREVTVDVRAVRQALPELQHLYRFMFHTAWSRDQGQRFWFDDFAILAAQP